MSLNKESLVREILGSIADKWTLVILNELEEGPYRFSVLQKKIPDISQKMLTQTLRSMESNGLIERRVFPEVPPRVEYKLTKIGLSLGGAVCGIWKWAQKYQKDVEKVRERFNRMNNKQNNT
jgi:DNA-binding HxlR family transcriptional regulator